MLVISAHPPPPDATALGASGICEMTASVVSNKSNGRRVLQRRADHFGRIDDARRTRFFVLLGLRVETLVAVMSFTRCTR